MSMGMPIQGVDVATSLPTRSGCLCGIKVSPLRRGELLDLVSAALKENHPLRLTFLNPDYARRALLDPELKAAINSFDVVLVDGNGVRLLTPLYGFWVPERLDTDSVAPDVFRLLAEARGSVFLFGCAPGVAKEAGRRLAHDHPGLQIAGTEHGYHDVEKGHPGRFDPEDSDRIVGEINRSRPDLVVVSLPTPLQQRWLHDCGERLATPVVMTGGSYLDHVAEGVAGRWYPRWADVLRLNWFYRFLRDPRRLWRRYTVEVVQLVILVVRDRLDRPERDRGFTR
jgi:N-acetylglucosaminyldiphosphoundecaprenol N-acetyl-beta-D-mannosaminyltransferase